MLYETGQLVPENGIYSIIHPEHRLPREIALVRGQQFPRCSRCASSVRFERIAQARPAAAGRDAIVVYELPEVEAPEMDAEDKTA